MSFRNGLDELRGSTLSRVSLGAIMNKIKHLLIDLDGTLVNFRELRVQLEFTLRFIYWWRAWARPWRTFKGLWRLNSAVSSDERKSSNYLKGIQAFALGSGLPEGQVSALMDECLNEIFPRLEKYFFPIPGAQEFVQWAGEHYPLTLATNPVWPPELVTMRLQWGGISMAKFGTMTHAKKMTACKPSLDYYSELLSQENLDPESCALIGNDIQSDGAAIGLGIRVFILSDSPQVKPLTHPKIRDTQGLLWTGNYKAIQSLLETESHL